MTQASASINIDHLRRWVGREFDAQDSLEPFAARALASALDRHPAPSIGDAMPPARHWLYFLETPTASSTGIDGHPKLGGFLPALPLARRMWAAGRLDNLSPLVLGKPATRKTVLQAVEAKAGKTGELVFVTFEHELKQEGTLCLREEQHLVYRSIPTARVPLRRGEAAPQKADFSVVFNPDPVLLFRYSALTYNAHRIHYDRSYAMDQEFYPALVVHGPLLATVLFDLLHDNVPGAQVQSFSYRALRPSFDTAPLTLNGRLEGNVVNLWSADADGYVGMSAVARLA